MAELQLSLLGTFALAEDGQPVDLNIAKVQALLAYLAITATETTREQLLTLLWAESHPDAARKNLRNRLWQLRQLTTEELILTEGDTIALAPAVQTDVVVFTQGITEQLATPEIDPLRLHALLERWRGPLLDGLQLHEAPDFELWLSRQRERLGELYLQGVEALIVYHTKRADWARVITLAQQGLAFDELHEPFYQQIMSAYAQQGRRGEALRQYDQLETTLATQLDLTPLPETVALRRRIAEDLSLANMPAPGERQLPATLPATQPELGVVTSPLSANTLIDTHIESADAPSLRRTQPFVGRQLQLDVLTTAYQASRQGQSRVVLISGELGMGKTTLWQQWVGQLPNDTVVLTTRCLNTTQSLPFEPMRRLLGTSPCRNHWARMADVLPPIWQAELVHLAPSLGSNWPTATAEKNTRTATDGQHAGEQAMQPTIAGTRLSPNEERGLIAEALTQFLHAFHGDPLVLFIDDLHWADGATLDWLLYLTDRMATEPLLLVGAYRPQEMKSQGTQLMVQWQRDGVLQRIDLPHFSEPESVALLTALGTDETVMHHLYTQSGGNPYYLTQLSDVAVDGIPASLADLVQARLRYLDERWQPILQAAAILEPTIALDLLSLTSGRSEEETVDALDGLLAAAILVEHGAEYEFIHPLVATVMREGLSNGRRKLLHRRAAEGLLTRHQGEQGEIAGQLAYHFAAAGVQDRAAHFATMAGAEALRIGAASEAVAFYRQALALAPNAERLLGLGQALMLQPGQLEEARRQMETALDTCEAAGDCQGAIKAGLRLAASYLGTQDGAQVLYWARRVLPDLETVKDPLLHASAHYLMGTAKFRNGYALHEAEAHYETGMKLATEAKLDPEIALMTCFEWGNLNLERGDYSVAVTKFQQARQLAQEWQSIFFEVLTLNNLAYAHLLAGDQNSAQRTIEQAFALANQYAMQSVHYYLLSTQGEIALAAQAFDAAENAFVQASDLAQKYDNPAFVANVWAQRGRVAHARGELSDAMEKLTHAKRMVATDKTLFLQTQIDLWIAEVAIAQHDDKTATTHHQDALRRLAATEYRQLHETAAQLSRLLQGSSNLL
ncbi:MAG: AAA family ATPase [Caldilineaceae bacterium]|nr:AAA family ATPase [Caldilineaceae bacterium]